MFFFCKTLLLCHPNRIGLTSSTIIPKAVLADLKTEEDLDRALGNYNPILQEDEDCSSGGSEKTDSQQASMDRMMQGWISKIV